MPTHLSRPRRTLKYLPKRQRTSKTQPVPPRTLKNYDEPRKPMRNHGPTRTNSRTRNTKLKARRTMKNPVSVCSVTKNHEEPSGTRMTANNLKELQRHPIEPSSTLVNVHSHRTSNYSSVFHKLKDPYSAVQLPNRSSNLRITLSRADQSKPG